MGNGRLDVAVRNIRAASRTGSGCFKSRISKRPRQQDRAGFSTRRSCRLAAGSCWWCDCTTNRAVHDYGRTSPHFLLRCERVNQWGTLRLKFKTMGGPQHFEGKLRNQDSPSGVVLYTGLCVPHPYTGATRAFRMTRPELSRGGGGESRHRIPSVGMVCGWRGNLEIPIPSCPTTLGN